MMMKLVLFLWVFFPAFVFAQEGSYGNLTVFSDKADKFFLYLDGEKKNELPVSKIRIEKLSKQSYNVKIVLDDASHFTITKNNVFISDGEDNLMEVAYKFSRNGNMGKLKFYSMNPVKENQLAVTSPVSSANKALAEESNYGTLHVFSEQGDPFFLYLDGELQNETAQPDIRIEKLNRLFYQVKIIYKDTKFNIVSRNNVYVSGEDDMMMDVTYKLSRSSGFGKLKFYSMNPVDHEFVPAIGTYVKRYGEKAGISSQPVPTNMNGTEAVIINKPVTETSGKGQDTGEKKGDKNIPGNPAIKKSTTAPGSKPTVSAKPEKTKPAPKANNPVKNPGAATEKNNISIKEPDGWICQNEWPMWKADYANAKKNIEEAKTDKLKLAAARVLVSSNCLSSDQVAEIGALLISDDTKLEFAKLAFIHTIDIKNYLKVARIFTSLKSKEALVQYISG
jgi:hypothetical protein